MTNSLCVLIGEIITDLLINDEKTVIQFKLTDGRKRTFITAGDCCSESWIEHVSGIKALCGAEILIVDELELRTIDGDGSRQEVDKIYGISCRTNKADEFHIEFRNSSNGYYGGALEEYDPHDDNHSETISELKPLLEDF